MIIKQNCSLELFDFHNLWSNLVLYAKLELGKFKMKNPPEKKFVNGDKVILITYLTKTICI